MMMMMMMKPQGKALKERRAFVIHLGFSVQNERSKRTQTTEKLRLLARREFRERERDRRRRRRRRIKRE